MSDLVGTLRNADKIVKNESANRINKAKLVQEIKRLNYGRENTIEDIYSKYDKNWKKVLLNVFNITYSKKYRWINLIIKIALGLLLIAPIYALLFWGIIPFLFGLYEVFMYLLVFLLIFFVVGKYRELRQRKIYNRIKNLTEKYHILVGKTEKLLDMYDNHPDIQKLPKEYRYPQCTNYLVNMAGTGRIASINEGLGKFDDQLHKWRMEDSQNELLEKQKREKREFLRELNQVKLEASLARSEAARAERKNR